MERVGLIVDVVSDWFAWVLPWNHIMENSETITTARVRMVVSELAHPFILRAHISASMWSNCMDLQIIPIAIAVGTTTPILDKVVVGVRDPEASRRLIRIEQRPTPLSHDDAVFVNIVLLFDSVLNENDVTFDVVSYIVDQPHIVCTVEGEGTIETLVGAETFAVRFMYCTDHVEVDGVATDLEGLTDVSEFDVFQASYKRIVTF